MNKWRRVDKLSDIIEYASTRTIDKGAKVSFLDREPVNITVFTDGTAVAYRETPGGRTTTCWIFDKPLSYVYGWYMVYIGDNGPYLRFFKEGQSYLCDPDQLMECTDPSEVSRGSIRQYSAYLDLPSIQDEPRPIQTDSVDGSFPILEDWQIQEALNGRR